VENTTNEIDNIFECGKAQVSSKNA